MKSTYVPIIICALGSVGCVSFDPSRNAEKFEVLRKNEPVSIYRTTEDQPKKFESAGDTIARVQQVPIPIVPAD